MMRLLGLVVALVVVPGLAIAEPPAREPSTNPSANQHFHVGNDAFNSGDFATAATEFEAAWKIDPVPSLLYAWAQAERNRGHCAEALELYRKYMYADITPNQLKATRTNIQICETQTAIPPSDPVKPQPEAPPAPEVWYRDRLVVGLSASGTVAVVIGITELVLASSSTTDAHHAMYLDQWNAYNGLATQRRRVGGVMLGLGAALIGGGVGVYLYRRDHAEPVMATTDGHSIVIGARF